MSVTELSKQFNDEEVTGIDTKMNHSHFYWKNNQFSQKIHHSSSNIPELAINEGTNILHGSLKSLAGRLMMPSIPPVAALIKI